jgi:hypothetical protein
VEDERSVRKLVDLRVMPALSARVRIDPLGVELGVDRVGSALSGMKAGPDRRETDVVVAAAERAGTMPGGEGRCLVEEEELREASRLKERRAVPAPEPQAARDPVLAVVPPPDVPGVVVEAAAVSVDEAAPRVGHQLPEGSDPVSQRHALLLVVLHRVLVSNVSALGAEARVAKRAPLAKQVPALVEAHLQRREPLSVRLAHAPTRFVLPEPVLLGDEAFDLLVDLFVVHHASFLRLPEPRTMAIPSL